MADRNLGLRIKQLYSCAIHPATTNYFLAGAQDNGTHQFNNAGLSSTVEITGGDGAFTAIDQNEPQYQFGAYVYNQYRRSTDGGASWTNVNLNAGTGLFINPFDYDNTANIMYCSDIASNYRRWTDPQTGSTSAVVNITSIVGNVTAVSVSPYTAHKVFFGTSSGRVVQVDGANVIASGSAGTDRSTGLPGGTVSCINFGTNDLNLMCVESNYGINNVWVSSDGGATWTAIDGNLPDMPVRWCMFYPGNNTKAYIATETGVWETDLINGASTIWNANPTFPTVRTDMIKYRASDRTIAAATHGRGLWTTTIPVVATPDLSFQNPTATTAEYTSYSSSCRGYTDYTHYMVISNSPTGAGMVTLGIAGGGTATNGIDYAITTNGNFAAPSMTLNFPGGSGTAQAFTVRIYDDAAVEPAETFTLNYTVTGGNAQPGGSNQTLTYTINDNDAAVVSGGSANYNLGSYNSNVGSATPFRSNQAKFRIQTLWPASELIAAGITSARNFTSMTLYVLTKNSTVPYTNFTISMANTAATTLASGFQAGTFTTVYPTTNYSSVVGANLFTFSTPFAWDGTSNVLINICFDNAAAEGLSDVTEGTTTAIGVGIRATTYSNNLASSPCTGAAAFITDSRIRANFGTNIPGTSVSTALSSNKTGYLGPFDDVYYYDASGNIIARIKNLSAFDYGCTQVIIDRAGSSSVQFWNNTPSNYLLSKTCKVIPSNNTTTGNYQITLYYTAAEVAGWEAATGRTWSASPMQVAKISNGFYVPDVTPLATHTSDVTYVSGTRGTLGADYSIRGDFGSTGFSGFGTGVLGVPLPISINYLTGTKLATGHLLKWKVNCNSSARATMVLERSSDARNFSSIYSITADALTCLQPFVFNDANPLNGISYYRLKVIDIDGKIGYSTVVALLNALKGYEIINLTPNPVTGDYFALNITSAIPLKVDFQITDMQGRLVKRFTAPLTAGFNSIPVNTNKLAAGTYHIAGNINGDKTRSFRFIKQ
jgi:hypothetical protein